MANACAFIDANDRAEQFANNFTHSDAKQRAVTLSDTRAFGHAHHEQQQ